MIQAEDILKAADRLQEYIHNTPILTSSYLDEMLSCKLYLKCENFQKTGSFKVRGATNSVIKLSETQKKAGVATHSSGNHGQALAWAAKVFGIKAYIVMPSNAPAAKKEAVKGYGAEVIECEPTLQAREATLEKIIKEKGAVFIPPYNFQNTIEGQATVALEILQEIPKPDYLFCPVGGGGLLSGTALSASFFCKETKVIGCEPEMADDAFQSLKAGRLIPSVNPETIADGLKTSLGDITFSYITKGVHDILLCSEEEIKTAMRLIWQRMKIIIEPSSAVPLACLIRYRESFKGKQIAMILTGGNIDLDRLPF